MLGSGRGGHRQFESHMQELPLRYEILMDSVVVMGYLVLDLSFIAGRELHQHRLPYVATKTRHRPAWHRQGSQLQLAVRLHHLVTLAVPQQHR